MLSKYTEDVYGGQYNVTVHIVTFPPIVMLKKKKKEKEKLNMDPFYTETAEGSYNNKSFHSSFLGFRKAVVLTTFSSSTFLPKLLHEAVCKKLAITTNHYLVIK